MYRVDRANEAIPVEVFLPLRPGDKVWVRRSSFEIVIAYADGRCVSVSAETSPYVVEDAGKVPDELDNLLYWARTIVDDFHGSTGISRVNLTSRAGAAGPLLVADETQFVAGDATTLLVKGVPPTQVSMQNRNLEFVATPGTYSRLRVRLPAFDGPRTLGLGGLKVVLQRMPASSVPACQQAAEAESQLGKVACAFSLASQPGWSLEGLHRLAELDDPSPTI